MKIVLVYIDAKTTKLINNHNSEYVKKLLWNVKNDNLYTKSLL
jgi:hypothetical protein